MARGATSTPAHLIFTKPWLYQSSSVPDLEFTMGPGTIEKIPCEQVAHEGELSRVCVTIFGGL